jgi:choice-of-anchor C domain-containing protein
VIRTLICLFLLIMTGSLSRASLLINGSFESGGIAEEMHGGAMQGFATAFPGGVNTGITGWTVFGHSVDYISHYWPAFEGDRSIDLSGTDDTAPQGNYAGGVHQDVPTEPRTLYQLVFWLSGNPEGNPEMKTLHVGVDGNVAGTFTFDTTGQSKSSMNWAQHSLLFSAADSSTRISFESRSFTSFGPVVDAAQLFMVPEPSSIYLIAAGLVGLVAVRARLRRSGHD